MPLVKTAAQLNSLRLAKLLMPNPEAVTLALSTNGVTDLLQKPDAETMLANPMVALWLWAEAYGDTTMKRKVLEATDAMEKLNWAFTKHPPAAQEDRLNDPSWSHKGYSLAAFWGGFGYPWSKESARECVAAQLAPKPPPAPPKPPIESEHAWIDTRGKLIPVSYEGHVSWCHDNDTTEADCEKRGWVKISKRRITLYRALKQRQRDTLFDWCEHHGIDWKRVEKAEADGERMDLWGRCIEPAAE